MVEHRASEIEDRKSKIGNRKSVAIPFRHEHGLEIGSRASKSDLSHLQVAVDVSPSTSSESAYYLSCLDIDNGPDTSSDVSASRLARHLSVTSYRHACRLACLSARQWTVTCPSKAARSFAAKPEICSTHTLVRGSVSPSSFALPVNTQFPTITSVMPKLFSQR